MDGVRQVMEVLIPIIREHNGSDVNDEWWVRDHAEDYARALIAAFPQLALEAHLPGHPPNVPAQACHPARHEYIRRTRVVSPMGFVIDYLGCIACGHEKWGTWRGAKYVSPEES